MMGPNQHRQDRSARAFLGALVRDVRANTIAIMAMALIPLAGMIGGAVDISRMYIVKTRLQHACDAGALAGRKTMGGGTWSYKGYAAKTAAENFFDANYNRNAYGATSVQRDFSENAGKVSGTASATVPMTLMRIFGRTTEKLTVACDAEMRLPNTDVMFVLDVTGSMASKAKSSDPDTKIESLKTAVKCFYEIVARLDTDAACTTGTPSGGTGSQVQIRFGFVPYSTNVNVGKLLPTSYFADKWSYQTREAEWNNGTTNKWVQNGNPAVTSWSKSMSGVPYNMCNDKTAADYGFNTTKTDYSDSGKKKTVTEVMTHITGWSNNVCYYTQTQTVTIYQLTGVPDRSFKQWHYGQIELDVSGLKNGTSWNDKFKVPIGSNGNDRMVNWDGCIEERPTVRKTNYWPIPSDAYDLNIDLVPNQSDSKTLWGPALPDVIFARDVTSSWSQLDSNDAYTAADYYNNIPYYCPAEAKKLQTWPSASGFDSYVDSLYPTGNTYHDIGMLWGARFLSPTGMFASENAYTPQGGEIERHMIFMTDGDAVSAPCDYTAYGVAWFDKRTTTDVGPASNCTSSRSSLDNQVNARFSALCSAVKNQNITLWVISFGSGSNSTTETRLEQCATDGRYFVARDSATLQATFKSIADQISQLRLTR